MLGFEVFDAGILPKMGLHNWLEIPGIADLVSSAITTTTADGHLVFWEELTGVPAEAKAYLTISSACCSEEDVLNDPVLLHIFFKEKEHLGRYFRIERFTYTTENLPEIYGNGED